MTEGDVLGHEVILCSVNRSKADLQSSESPIPPRVTFSSLPDELITSTINFTNPHTSTVLARVSRRLSKLANTGIWSSLSLYIDPYYADPPHVGKYFRAKARPNGGYTVEQNARSTERRIASDGDEAHRAAIQSYIMGIIGRAEEKHWRMVKRIQLVPREGTTDGAVEVLQRVASTLQILEIESVMFHDYSNVRDLDEAILKAADLHFPTLRHVRIDHHAIHSPPFISFLCSIAPRMISLDIVVDRTKAPSASDAGGMQAGVGGQRDIQSLNRHTVLESLRITFSGDVIAPLEQRGPDHIVLELLGNSPLLKLVSLDYSYKYGDWAFAPIVKALRNLQDLRDLCWTRLSTTKLGRRADDETVKGELSVQRLLFDLGAEWLDAVCVHPCALAGWLADLQFLNLPALPTLQTLYIVNVDPCVFDVSLAGKSILLSPTAADGACILSPNPTQPRGLKHSGSTLPRESCNLIRSNYTS